jgi:cardiolipin synthase
MGHCIVVRGRELVAIVVVAVIGAGCTAPGQAPSSATPGAVGTAGSGAAVGSAGSRPAVGSAVGPAPVPAASVSTVAAAGRLSLLVEPDAGIGPIDDLVSAASHSIDLTMYELVDPTIENLLDAAVARGVRVRVILDGRLERDANQPAYDELRAHGVEVVWSSSAYESTHEKAMVIDDTVAVVMTLNLTSRYYDDTRDFAVIDRDAGDVAAVETVFAADLIGAPVVTPAGDDLVWSPDQSTTALTGLIGSAHSTLMVENEEMSSTSIIDALDAAAARGVHVTVVMTDSSEWSSAFARLTAAGVQVRTYAPNAALYIHAKAIVADGRRAFVGSQNFSSASFTRNRELGVLTSDPAVIGPLAAALAADAAGAAPWSGT